MSSLPGGFPLVWTMHYDLIVIHRSCSLRVILDEERQPVGLVLLWRRPDGWLQVEHVPAEIGPDGCRPGMLRLVRIVISGFCQSVTFLGAGALAHDVYVFGVAGAVRADQPDLWNQMKKLKRREKTSAQFGVLTFLLLLLRAWQQLVPHPPMHFAIFRGFRDLHPFSE